MNWFNVSRVLQTDVAISGVVITTISLMALSHWPRATGDTGGYVTLLGLAIKWLPAAVLYCYAAWMYWVNETPSLMQAPNWLRAAFHLGLITGSAILISRFQPWFSNRSRFFLVWSLCLAFASFLMIWLAHPHGS